MIIDVYRRSLHDDRIIGIDFTKETDFAETPITSAVVSAPPGSTLVISTPDVTTTPNVVAFRLSGGVVGLEKVTVEATNGLDTMCVSINVRTMAC